MKDLETIILENLLCNEEYSKTITSFLKREYFKTEKEKTYFEFIQKHIHDYQTVPTKNQLFVYLDKKDDLNDSQYNEVKELIESIGTEKQELEWLVKETESWARERAIHNGILESISILDQKSKKSKNEIPQILSDALAVSIDDAVGHNYLRDFDYRWDLYWSKEDAIPFDIEYFNELTNGGIPNKHLMILMAGTNGGKTLTKCHMAASMIAQGYNVLYVTLELPETKIAQRIDANLMDIAMNDIRDLGKDIFMSKIQKLKQKSMGELYIKEYPGTYAGVGHFRYLLRELRIKENFKPNIIFIDYLNLCMSSRLDAKARSNTYDYVRSLTEEVRGLAQEQNLPIISSTQLNREGMTSSDPGLENTAESIGLAFTADVVLAAYSTEDMQRQGVIAFKQLKNRLNDVTVNVKRLVGIDRPKMRLFNMDQPEYTSGANNQNTPEERVTDRRERSERRDFSKLKV